LSPLRSTRIVVGDDHGIRSDQINALLKSALASSGEPRDCQTYRSCFGRAGELACDTRLLSEIRAESVAANIATTPRGRAEWLIRGLGGDLATGLYRCRVPDNADDNPNFGIALDQFTAGGMPIFRCRVCPKQDYLAALWRVHLWPIPTSKIDKPKRTPEERQVDACTLYAAAQQMACDRSVAKRYFERRRLEAPKPKYLINRDAADCRQLKGRIVLQKLGSEGISTRRGDKHPHPRSLKRGTVMPHSKSLVIPPAIRTTVIFLALFIGLLLYAIHGFLPYTLPTVTDPLTIEDTGYAEGISKPILYQAGPKVWGQKVCATRHDMPHLIPHTSAAVRAPSRRHLTRRGENPTYQTWPPGNDDAEAAVLENVRRRRRRDERNESVQESNYDDSLLPPDEAANFLRVSKSFLAKARMRGDGPPYLQLGPRSIRYSKRALIEWMRSRRRKSTNGR
jgi:predicted DNA-binding transcriptional regulator AlpA